jgi:FAD/FMN-containing dehydrogenase
LALDDAEWIPAFAGMTQYIFARERNIFMSELTDAIAMAPHLNDWRSRYHGNALAVVKPNSTEQVAAIVKLCAETRTAIVPQGGNTSLCGASVPSEKSNAIVLSLTRLNKVRGVDLDNNTITIEAGCLLAQLQQIAQDHDRLFPLSLAAEGSCTIGGNLSTNAGGTAVLRYGNTRELTLGLEVVLPSGEVWSALRGLRKDNTGYDLKQLFIGAEGTLGVITAAVLKLYPRPKSNATAFVGVTSPSQALKLFNQLRANCAERLTGFELISRLCLDFVLRHIPNTSDPLTTPYPWYVLVELSESAASLNAGDMLEQELGIALEQSAAVDAVVAKSTAQSLALWALRENIAESQRFEGASIKHDVSVPISSVPEFVTRASAALEAAFHGVRIVAFGHMGDGNLHYNVSRPLDQSDADFFAQSHAVNEIVHDLVHSMNGSISAEHGLGQLKRDEIKRYKSKVELDLKRSVKLAWDPLGIMNPGKVI